MYKKIFASMLDKAELLSTKTLTIFELLLKRFFSTTLSVLQAYDLKLTQQVVVIISIKMLKILIEMVTF